MVINASITRSRKHGHQCLNNLIKEAWSSMPQWHDDVNGFLAMLKQNILMVQLIQWKAVPRVVIHKYCTSPL